MEIRLVKLEDAEEICEIYNHYIRHTTITFEELPIEASQMQSRIEDVTEAFPWLVCIDKGEVVGYSYARAWKERAAYRHTAEATVYVRDGFNRRGYGLALYDTLIPKLFQQGCHVVLGCIALPNQASVSLHEQLGFKKVAHFHEVGRKFDNWLDVGYWQLAAARSQPETASPSTPR